MAGALWKKEVVIRQNSTIGIVAAQNWTKNWLASFQDNPVNIDENGDYIDHFFGDLFDARTGNLYRIFSDAAGVKYSMPNVIFDVLITSKFVPWDSVSDNPDLATDEDFLITRGGVADVIDEFISEAKIINDGGIINNNKITLSNTPVGGIIGGTCRIKIGAVNVFDEVDCVANGNILTVLPDQGVDYEGEMCLVSYLINT